MSSYLYEIDRNEFTADPDLSPFVEDEQTLTPEQVEERMEAVLRAWGWTEERRDDALLGAGDPDDWQHDTDLAYRLAVTAPSGTPLTVFTAILEARGWPRTDTF